MRIHQFLEELEEMINDAKEIKDADARFLKLLRANERYISLIKLFEQETLMSLLTVEEHKDMLTLGVSLIDFMVESDKEQNNV